MSFAANPIGSAAAPCGFRSFLCRFELATSRFETPIGVFGSFLHGIDSFPRGMKSFPSRNESFLHGNEFFRCRFEPATIRFNLSTTHFGASTIGLLTETYSFTRFLYCSTLDLCVLATDPSFFAPDSFSPDPDFVDSTERPRGFDIISGTEKGFRRRAAGAVNSRWRALDRRRASLSQSDSETRNRGRI